ncbi:gamma-glutamylcyclotransferase [Chelatococcus reniformis]|uniref:glutathione-specific gamma-glutamylcyclotransferase n=2 Tax=Chelatococcus reniformis TaxID=1494448 RepID=A0A916XQF4_9HYPH|nr:gamma-glutamylcyclotransferase [Chelatococcus reniformis]
MGLSSPLATAPSQPPGGPEAGMSAAGEDLWVFGYGSLMWRPGFPFLERHIGRVHGYHRSLCVYSHYHRGTPEEPGLVLGLDRGGSCRGSTFRVAAARRDDTIAYLREREQVTSVYLERTASVTLDSGVAIRALVYIVDRTHPQYAGRLAPAEVVRLVRHGVGQSGVNPDYVRSTHAQLLELGVHDPVLSHVVGALEAAE